MKQLQSLNEITNADLVVHTTDDVCPTNLEYFKYWDMVKEKIPEFKLTCFTIANYNLREDVRLSEKFNKWYDAHKDWITIGVHGYDHMSPPEGERKDFEELTVKALEILKSYLPEKFLYRAPGFQTTCFTEPILKKLGFAGIAHQSRIKYFDSCPHIVEPFNTHCTEDKYDNPIGKIWKSLA